MDSTKNFIYRYKYLRFDKGSRKVVTEGTIRFTSPLEFNDPFDSKPFMELEHLAELHKKRPDILKKSGEIKIYGLGKRIVNRSKMIAGFKKVLQGGTYDRLILSRVGIV